MSQDRVAPQSMYAFLHRKVLAAHRHRAIVAHRLGMTESEVLALTYLAQGPLTPAQLSQRLHLTSGGVTALLRRLEGAGHVTRRPHHRDRRSVILVASHDVLDRMAELYAPLVKQSDALTASFTARERAVICRYLEQIAILSERTVDELVSDDHDEDLTEDHELRHIWA